MKPSWYLPILFNFLLEAQSSLNNMDKSNDVSAAIAKFSAKFINELGKDKNVVSSPLSAEFVLALLTLGTTDPAHKELLDTLGFPDDDAIRSSFHSVSSKLKSIKGVTLNIANKVYIQDGEYDLLPELKKDAIAIFDAEFEKLNFGNSAHSTKMINDWVEGKTNHKIKDLLSADSVDGDTRLVLVNALYFKGTWKTQFDEKHTKLQPFHITAQKTVEIPMMYQESTFEYGESEQLDAQFLKMDYVDGGASMVIVLPNEIEGLKDLLTKLASGFDLVHEMKKSLHSSKLQLTIPKFKIETEIDLQDLLPKMGISAIFNASGTTGLTKLLNKPELLYVSKAVQKAFIEVNEQGAEAAAATGMVATMRCAKFVLPFYADRPFLYLILASDQTIVFTGVYAGNE